MYQELTKWIEEGANSVAFHYLLGPSSDQPRSSLNFCANSVAFHYLLGLVPGERSGHIVYVLTP